MKVLDFAQRSDNWHAWRATGMSASTAAVVLGISPYKTPWRLWAEKTGRAVEEDLSRNPHVRRGLELEDSARICLERKLQEDFLLPMCIQSSENPIMLASLDGATAKMVPTELKCPCESQYLKVVNMGEKSEGYQLYYPQVQQQIYVAESDFGWLMFYNPANNGDYRLFRVNRDDKLIREIIAKSEWLWEHVQKDKAPPMDPSRDVFIPKGSTALKWSAEAEQFKSVSKQIKALKAQIDVLEKRKDASQDVLQAMMGDFLTADYAGVTLTRYEQQGSVDYKRIIEEHLPKLTDDEIERYRKAGSQRCRATVTDREMPANIVDRDVSTVVTSFNQRKTSSHYF
jgi:putative phage-type endonuclease